MKYFNVERRPVNGQYDDLDAVNQATGSVAAEQPRHILIEVPNRVTVPDNGRWTAITEAVFLARKAAVQAAAEADPRPQQERDDEDTIDALLAKAATAAVTAGELKAVIRRAGLRR